MHPLGHGVGLQIHEAPLLGATGSGRLAAGMAVTVEPGVYLEGRGGVRIEDTLVVTDGAPEVLTRFPKESAGDLTGLSWTADDGARRRSSARAAHPGACSPRATDERRSHTPWPPRTTSRTAWC